MLMCVYAWVGPSLVSLSQHLTYVRYRPAPEPQVAGFLHLPKKRHRQDLNLRGQSPFDFGSNSITTRTRCLPGLHVLHVTQRLVVLHLNRKGVYWQYGAQVPADQIARKPPSPGVEPGCPGYRSDVLTVGLQGKLTMHGALQPVRSRSLNPCLLKRAAKNTRCGARTHDPEIKSPMRYQLRQGGNCAGDLTVEH